MAVHRLDGSNSIDPALPIPVTSTAADDEPKEIIDFREFVSHHSPAVQPTITKAGTTSITYHVYIHGTPSELLPILASNENWRLPLESPRGVPDVDVEAIADTVGEPEPTFNRNGIAYPMLVCKKCTFHNAEVQLYIGNSSYQGRIQRPCWESAYIASFSAMLAHIAHHPRFLYVHCQIPTTNVTAEEVHPYPKGKNVVSVLHGSNHYVVLELDATDRTIWICDGKHYDLLTWTCHITNILKRTGMICLDVMPQYGAKSDYAVQLYVKVDGKHEWSVKSTSRVSQMDDYNCGPIPCLKLWTLFQPGEVDAKDYRAAVVSKWRGQF
ncbi:hypothetical protein IV203_005369 [Nitzschia inconspicua]|uniref:Uncharacterized protein n=1 Tax=Nitzschia inconspicua TaxID=303405 RepID=A0A9K3PGV8_9STRA|nr:hypothetical protein IV203_005369 [Nitzschia inconspicua]